MGSGPTSRDVWSPGGRTGPRNWLPRLDPAVRRQLISDVPVGAFPSGGLDSSGIVAAMAAEHRGEVRCYTIAFDQIAKLHRPVRRRPALRPAESRTPRCDVEGGVRRSRNCLALAEAGLALDEPIADPGASILWVYLIVSMDSWRTGSRSSPAIIRRSRGWCGMPSAAF